jgi:hypothetical protein
MNRADEVFALFVDANPVLDVTTAGSRVELNLPKLEGSVDMQTQDQPIQVELPPRPPIRRKRLIPALAGVAVVIVAIVVGVAIFAGSDESGPDAVEPGPITSFEDIAGTTYLRQGPGGPNYLLFLEDGTVHSSPNTDLIVDDPVLIHETSFEGTSVFMTTTGAMCNQPDLGGTYEIHLLESGNVAFVPIDEDTCELRSANLHGFTDGEITVEFGPVP